VVCLAFGEDIADGDLDTAHDGHIGGFIGHCLMIMKRVSSLYFRK